MLAGQQLLPLRHRPNPFFLFYVDSFVGGRGTRFCYTAQDDLKLLGSADPLASASLSALTTGTQNHDQQSAHSFEDEAQVVFVVPY